MTAHTQLMEGVDKTIEIIVIVAVIMIAIEGEEKGTDMMTEMGMVVAVEVDTVVVVVVEIGVLLVAAMTSEDEAVHLYL